MRLDVRIRAESEALVIAAAPDVDLDFSRPGVREFIVKATSGEYREVAAFGARGDGKTQGAFGAMVLHAQKHAAGGFPLPTRWVGVADTFQSHKLKTIQSLRHPMWQGAWTVRDQGHLATFRDRDVEVELHLFGIEDQGAADRMRMEFHGMWFEEPAAAAVMVQSSGIDKSSWLLGLTSQGKGRTPTYHTPAIMTLNLPDLEHWTWQRYVADPRPGTAYVRIPQGERATAEDRQSWREALADRPDMIRRLIDGEPGTILLGQQVAVGFSYDVHVASERIEPVPSEPLWLGTDGGGGLTWVTVVGQRVKGRCRILGAILSDPAGAEQHYREDVIPWLSRHAPWVVSRAREHGGVKVVYDPNCDQRDSGNVESNALRTMQKLLPGTYRPGPVDWEGRNQPILALFNAMEYGQPVLQVDPRATGLIQALGGGWYYPVGRDGKVSRDKPKKPNHPHEDYGDAFAYLITGMRPLVDRGHRVVRPNRVDFELDYAHPAARGPQNRREFAL